jgi:hypothetical protein
MTVLIVSFCHARVECLALSCPPRKITLSIDTQEYQCTENKSGPHKSFVKGIELERDESTYLETEALI